jgi:branched-chain amino acid transport system substrate-binding protein
MWLPAPKLLRFSGVYELLRKYQAGARAEGVDPLGYYTAPLAFAQLQVMKHQIGDRRASSAIR